MPNPFDQKMLFSIDQELWFLNFFNKIRYFDKLKRGFYDKDKEAEYEK